MSSFGKGQPQGRSQRTLDNENVTLDQNLIILHDSKLKSSQKQTKFTRATIRDYFESSNKSETALCGMKQKAISRTNGSPDDICELNSDLES